MFLALLVMLLILAPNALWIFNHRELAFRSATKFQIGEHRAWLAAVIIGLKSLSVSTATFLCPLAMVYGLLFWKRPSAMQPHKPSQHADFLARVLLVIYAAILFSILVFRVTDIRDRWLQPVLVCAPVLAVALIQSRLTLARLKGLSTLAAAVALMVSVMIPGRIVLAERYQRTEPLNKPYDVIARQLKDALGTNSVVLTDSHLLGGNLRLKIPGKTFVTPESASLFADKGRPRALVWDATPSPKRKRQQGAETLPPPENLREYAVKTGLPELDESRAEYFSATFKYHRARQMKVGLLLLP